MRFDTWIDRWYRISGLGTPLRNKIGSGVGATADITNGYVSNVVLNNSGDGFRDDGLLELVKLENH